MMSDHDARREGPFAELAARLGRGEGLDDIRRTLLPDAWTEILKAAAVARLFDDTTYSSVLKEFAGEDPPSLAALKERGAVEEIAGRRLFRVPDAFRPSYFLSWLRDGSSPEIPDALVRLERRLSEHWHSRGKPAERLRHLMLADPDATVELFKDLFSASDARRDFTRCQDFTDALADPDRAAVAERKILELAEDRAGYLRARTYWTTDYARSAQFLEPDGLWERAQRLLSREGPRVWQMYGSGGSGKTMQLRWLVSRRAVTPEKDINCARIDFDVVDPLNAAHWPWLLLLEIADQLEQRLPTRVFAGLDEYAAYRSLLRRPTSRSAVEAARGIRSQDASRIEREVVTAFTTRFNQGLGTDQPVLIVVDTLEEVVVRSSRTDSLLRLLGETVKRCKAMRLILSGRPDLSQGHGPALATLGAYENVPVPGFTADEADRYLHHIRGIQDPGLREVIIRRSEGIPFHLALFADNIDQNPEATAESMDSLRDPLIRYLINRVIRRIEDPLVRWLLRYGVIPRRLRREHLYDILQPHLRQRMTAQSEEDDPLTDDHHMRGSDDVFPFVEQPLDKDKLDEAWRKVLTYAKGSSWISEVAEDQESVVFHGMVLGPMRDLISDKPIFAQLHADFAERFELRAQDDPDNWSWYLREALYHRFQMRDPGAPEAWRGAMERAWMAGETDRLRDLAEELLGEEYVDRGTPRSTCGGPLVTYALMAEAHLNIAYAQFRDGMVEGVPSDVHDHVWSEVELHLAEADGLYRRAGAGENRRHSVREEVVRATLLSLRGHPDDAVRLLEAAVLHRVGLPELEKLWALSILATSQRRLGSPDAANAFQRMLVFAGHIHRPDIAAHAASAEAAQYRLMGNVGRAIELYQQAAGLRYRAGVSVFQAVAQRAGLLLRCRRPQEALRVLDGVEVHSAREEADRARLQAKAQLLLGREGPALAALQRADAAAGQVPDAERYRQLAQNAQLRGVALGELHEIEGADDCFTSATGLWSELGYLAGEPECHYLYARFLLRGALDYTAAHPLLEPKEAPGQEPEFALRLQLLALEWAKRTGKTRVGRVPPLTYGELPALVRPLHALCRIAAHPEGEASEEALGQLTRALEKVQPVDARLATLRDLIDNPAMEGRVPWQVLRPFYEMEAGGDDPDHGLAQLLIMQVRGEAGPESLGRTVRTLVESGDGSRLIVWRCARIAARLGHRELAVRLLDRVPWEVPPRVPSGAPRIPHVRLALAALVLRAGVDPDPVAAGMALRRAIALAERGGGGATRQSVPVQLTDCALRIQVAGVQDRVGELLLGLQRPAFLDTDLPDDLRLFQDWRGELGFTLRARPEINPVDDKAVPHPANLAKWHDDMWQLRTELINTVHGPLSFVRLESEDPAAHALPWELALQSALETSDGQERPVIYRTVPTGARRVDVCWLQLGLNRRYGLDLDVDGIVGPQTRQALDRLQPGAATADWPLVEPETRWELQRDMPSEPGTRKVLVLSARQDERSVPLSYWLRGRRPLLGQFPARLLVVEPGTDLAERLAAPTEEVDILHVAAPLRQRDGMPYLELSPVGHARRLASKARGSDLFPVQLSRYLAGFQPGRRPLIVLDPPCPGSEVDIHVQLALRNLFAAQLFRLGHCPAVVCTGLFPGGGLKQVLGFYQSLSAQGSLADAVRELRTTEQPGGPGRGTTFKTDDDARRATALYAAGSSLLKRPMGRT